MKKVLIITYYWPPSGGAGVQRWLKFVKYLRNFGWEPVIYTPENPEAPAIDYSLQKDIPENLTVIKRRIWEPYSLYKRITGLKQDEKIKAGFLSEKKKPSFAENLAVRIRGNLFIPDARKFWIKPSVKFLTEYLKENPVDAIVSTGPPHSMHMIALGIKKRLNIPWLADFRDPWTNIDFYGELGLFSYADRMHRKMEQQVLKSANILTTVSWNWAKDFIKLGAENIEVVTNGFDPADFESIRTRAFKNNSFEICHIGAMNKDRNPVKLWKTIADICNENSEFAAKFKITFIGQTDISVKVALEKNGLIKYANFENYKPHNEVLKMANRAAILLLALNNTPNVEGIVPGKLFEYLAIKKSILCVGSITGDSARIIEETNRGITVDFTDRIKMKRYLINKYEKFISNNDYEVEYVNIERYSRKTLTHSMARLLEKII
jgi:hypothetical protein